MPLPDAIQLTASRETARYFELTMQAPVGVQLSGKTTANWILGEISARLNRDGIEIEQAPVQPNEFAQLQARLQDHTISASVGKDLLDTMWQRNVTVAITGVSATASLGNVDAIIEEKGLKQISDLGAIEKVIDDVIAANASERNPQAEAGALSCIARSDGTMARLEHDSGIVRRDHRLAFASQGITA